MTSATDAAADIWHIVLFPLSKLPSLICACGLVLCWRPAYVEKTITFPRCQPSYNNFWGTFTHSISPLQMRKWAFNCAFARYSIKLLSSVTSCNVITRSQAQGRTGVRIMEGTPRIQHCTSALQCTHMTLHYNAPLLAPHPQVPMNK